MLGRSIIRKIPNQPNDFQQLKWRLSNAVLGCWLQYGITRAERRHPTRMPISGQGVAGGLNVARVLSTACANKPG